MRLFLSLAAIVVLSLGCKKEEPAPVAPKPAPEPVVLPVEPKTPTPAAAAEASDEISLEKLCVMPPLGPPCAKSDECAIVRLTGECCREALIPVLKGMEGPAVEWGSKCLQPMTCKKECNYVPYGKPICKRGKCDIEPYEGPMPAPRRPAGIPPG